MISLNVNGAPRRWTWSRKCRSPGSCETSSSSFAFFAIAGESGELEVEWSDDRGEKGRVSAKVNVA